MCFVPVSLQWFGQAGSIRSRGICRDFNLTCMVQNTSSLPAEADLKTQLVFPDSSLFTFRLEKMLEKCRHVKEGLDLFPDVSESSVSPFLNS